MTFGRGGIEGLKDKTGSGDVIMHERDMGCSHERDMGLSYERDVGRSNGRDMGRSHERDVGCSHERDTERSYGRDMGRSHERDMWRSHERDARRSYERHVFGIPPQAFSRRKTRILEPICARLIFHTSIPPATTKIAPGPMMARVFSFALVAGLAFSFLRREWPDSAPERS